MEPIKETGFENQQERLARVTGHFLEMINRPDRMGNQIQIIIKGLAEPKLPAEAQECMDQVVSRLLAILPAEDQDMNKEEIENMVRATLEENHI